MSLLALYFRWLMRQGRLVLLFALAITLWLGYQATQVPIDPQMDVLFDKEGKSYQTYSRYREKYGSDRIVLLAMEGKPDMFSLSHLGTLEYLSEAIKHFPEVEQVISLGTVMDIHPDFLWTVQLAPALGNVFGGERSMDSVRRQVLGNETFVGNLISSDGSAAAILIILKPSGKEEGSEWFKSLNDLIRSHESKEMNFFMAGGPVEQIEIARLLIHDLSLFIPLSTAIILLVIFLFYRNLRITVLIFTMLAITLCWTVGTATLAGKSLNLLTSLTPCLIMIIATANSVHGINLFLRIRPNQPSGESAVLKTYRELLLPVSVTHLTTLIAFMTLAFHPVQAVQSFGILAGVGILYSFVIQISILPVLLVRLPATPSSGVLRRKALLGGLIKFCLRKGAWPLGAILLAVASLGAGFAGTGLEKIKINTNVIKQINPGSPLAAATDFIDKNITGVYSIGLTIRKQSGEPLNDYESLGKIERLRSRMEELPHITKVNSIALLLGEVHEAVEEKKGVEKMPPDTGRIRRYLEEISKESPTFFRQWMSPGMEELRLEARMKSVGTRKGRAVEKKIRRLVRRHLGNGFDYEITGSMVLLGQMAHSLVRNQFYTFLAALAGITLLILIIFRSITLTLLALIPTLLPILVLYGFMGHFSIPLSLPTAMISSIALGMVVDAAIHFLYDMKRKYEATGNYYQSFYKTVLQSGVSLTIATLILALGFSCSLAASFQPTRYFGILTGATLILSLLFTLIVLPVLIFLFRPFKMRETRGRQQPGR